MLSLQRTCASALGDSPCPLPALFADGPQGSPRPLTPGFAMLQPPPASAREAEPGEGGHSDSGGGGIHGVPGRGGPEAGPGVGVAGARAGDGTCLPPQEDEAAVAPADVAGRTEPTRRGNGHGTLYVRLLLQCPDRVRARGEGPRPRAANARPSGSAGTPLSGRGEPYVRRFP